MPIRVIWIQCAEFLGYFERRFYSFADWRRAIQFGLDLRHENELAQEGRLRSRFTAQNRLPVVLGRCAIGTPREISL